MTDILTKIEFYTSRLQQEKPSNIDIFDEIAIVEINNSNRIEGNTLTYSQTFSILNSDITELHKFKTKEELEILSYREALDYVIHDIYSFEINQSTICNIQYILLKLVKPQEAGIYRRGYMDYVGITGSDVILLDGNMVEEFLDRAISSIYYESTTLHPLIAIARFKQRFIYCHPFFDGNGRTSRILMNTLLLKMGWYPFIIKAEDRKLYFTALRNSIMNDDEDIFTEWFLNAYVDNLKELINKCCK